MTDSLFTKIIKREIPADIEYEDEVCVAFKDIHPKAPVHLLIVPRKEIPSVADLQEEDGEIVQHLIYTAKQIAEEKKLDGYRLQFNVGHLGGQEIFHLHLHLLGWRK